MKTIKKIEQLRNNYINMREQSQQMKAYVKDPKDMTKLDAGIVTFDLVIEDLNNILDSSKNKNVRNPREEFRNVTGKNHEITSRGFTHSVTYVNPEYVKWLEERIISETPEEVDISTINLKLSLAEAKIMIDKLDELQDQGPQGAGWKSHEFERLIAKINNSIESQIKASKCLKEIKF